MKVRLPIIIAITLTLFAVFAFSPSRHAQGFKKMVMAVAYVQDGAPIQIDSVTHGIDFLFSKAEIKNVSEHTVRSVTFGVLLHEADSEHGAPILASSREIQTDIKPGATRTLDVLDLSLNEAQQRAGQLKSSAPIAEFGILAVKLDDGGSWSVDAPRTGSFGRIGALTSAGPSAKNCKPTTPSRLLAVLDTVVPSLSVVLAQGYTCVGSTNNEVCTNNVSSCTNKVCTH